MPQHLALLRGINVGGKNKLPMRDLVRLFESAGCTNVATYIQSGNVVFDASAAIVKSLSRSVSAAIEREFGWRVPVLLRTADEIAKTAASSPFRDLEHTHVIFLAELPSRAAIAALDPNRSPGDEFEVAGREIYAFCPHGVARTKLTNDYFDRALSTTSTSRNFRTVLALKAMVQG